MKTTRRPRYAADPMAMFRAVNKVKPFDAAELTQLSLPVRVAFDCLRTGEGQEVHFHTLAAAVNVALIRSESIDQLCVEICKRAQDALMSVLARSKRLGKWGLDAAGLQDNPARRGHRHGHHIRGPRATAQRILRQRRPRQTGGLHA